MNIPQPYPDEHVLGWRGRIRLFNHYPDIRHTVADLRSWVRRQKPLDQPPIKSLPQLMLFAKACGMEPRDFAIKHSSLPFIRAFMPDAFDVKSSEQTMLNVVSLFGLQTGKNGAWFCAECVSKDLQIHGIPYWRRDHQLCGVNWCYRHRRKLLGFSSHATFDKSPPVHLFGIELLLSGGPQFLDDTAQIVQSFATIAKALLDRRVRLSPTKVADLLRSQALTMMPDGGPIEQFCLQNLAEEKLPDFWKKNFYQKKGPGKDRDLLNFNIAFRHSQYSAPTVLYVIALALLFKTPVEALLKLDEAEDVRIVPENMKFRYEREFWSSDFVLHEYVKNRGSYDSYSLTVGTDSLRTSNSLKTYGLPNLSNVSEQHRIALLAFFEGTSLFEICQTYHVEITDIENILRIAGSRLAKGLQDISDQSAEVDS